MIDKSMRPNYEMQGEVRNYLGKQKMVKAPVKWKSGPDKPETELAYITKAEKDLILKADIHGSLKKGPNIGPSGIMSLDSWGDRSGGQAGADVSRDTDRGGGGRPDPRTTYSYSPPAPKPEPRVSPIQSMAMKGDISLAGKTQDEAQASVDRDNKIEQMKKAMKTTVIYRKPFELPTPKKPVMKKTSRTGPFKRDDSDYQDRIRQAKSKIEFDPNLSREEKADRNKILDNFVSKSTFAAEPKKNLFDMIKGGVTGLGKAYLGTLLPKPIQYALTGRKIAETIRPGITEDLLKGKVKFSGNENVNRSNVRDTRDEQNTRDGQRVSTGTDAVTRSVKKYTGEKETQQTDSKRSQLLLLLKKLQEYDSQNRLNDRGKQYLAELTSFMNRPLPGRSRDI